MGHLDFIDEYRNAFNAAVTQHDQIRKEIDFLKSRRALVEEAARTLERLIFPDEYPLEEVVSSPAPMVEIDRPPAPAELDSFPPSPGQDPEQRLIAAVTQVYVRGESDSTDEIQRRIDIALGRTAAD